MTIQETASAILKRMEEGTQAIYARYREKARQSDASYQKKLSDLETDYRESGRDLSGQAQAALNDRLTSLSDLGLGASGAAEQARISARTALLRSLGQLSVQREKDRSAAKAAYDSETAALAAEGEEKAEKYRDSMTKLLLEQQNKDREFQEKQQQNQEKLAIQKEKLALQKQNAAKSASGKSGASGEAGLTLKETPAKMMNTIVKACRQYNKSERYYYVDREQVQKAVMRILNDTRITKSYRYQLYVQARAMGYVE